MGWVGKVSHTVRAFPSFPSVSSSISTPQALGWDASPLQGFLQH